MTPLHAVLTLAHSSDTHLITGNDVIQETVTFSLALVQQILTDLSVPVGARPTWHKL